MQIRDSSLKVLSLSRCLKSPRPGMLIVFSASRCLDNQTTFQRVLYRFWQPTSRTPFHAHFDINLASSQFSSGTLSVDFCCPKSTLSIPEAGKTAETPVKRYCNTGKVPIRTQNQDGCVHSR